MVKHSCWSPTPFETLLACKFQKKKKKKSWTFGVAIHLHNNTKQLKSLSPESFLSALQRVGCHTQWISISCARACVHVRVIVASALRRIAGSLKWMGFVQLSFQPLFSLRNFPELPLHCCIFLLYPVWESPAVWEPKTWEESQSSP